MKAARRISLFVILVLAGQGTGLHASDPGWRHLSSKKGDLAVPGTSTQQTACLVADLDRCGRNGFVIGFRATGPALVWYRPSKEGWDRLVIEPDFLTVEAGGAVHDIDGDGWPDLVFGGDWQSNCVWWWRNPGENWQSAARWERHTIKKSGKTQHHDQCIADFKGLGKPQVAYWNQGASTLFVADIPSHPRQLDEWPADRVFTGHAGEGPGKYAEGMSSCDIDGDGRPEILAGNYMFSYEKNGNWRATRIGDIGGLIFAGRFIKDSRHPQVVIAPGDGSGPVKWYECNGNPAQTQSWVGHDLVGRALIHPHSLQVGDVNGDGNLDIFVAEMAKWTESRKDPDNPKAQAFLFYGDGKGHFRKTIFQTGMEFHEARVADLNGDGKLDILSKPYNWETPRLDIWLNQGPVGPPAESAYVKESKGSSKPQTTWELMMLDPVPGSGGETGSTAVGDIDGDGKQEVVIGGVGELLWYRPSTFEKGLVGRGHFHCGVALLDIDGDGRKEVIAGHSIPGERWVLSYYSPAKDLKQPFTEHVIDPLLDPNGGGPHDVLVADIDGDGKAEVISNSMYSSTPALYIYKPGADLTKPWKKQVVQKGLGVEGTTAGDLEGKGQMDLVSGPYWFSPPAAGPFSGQIWQKHKIAPNFRDMCRVALIDVNGDGRLDAVITESEYRDGHFSWFENRVGRDANHPWVEHPIEHDLIFAHSLQAWRDPQSQAAHVFVGEMNEGGWGQPYNFDARLLEYTLDDHGKSVHKELLYRGEGTHQAVVADVDGDGVAEIVGHSGQVINSKFPDCLGWVQVFKQHQGPPPFQKVRHEFIDQSKPTTGTDILWTDVDGDGLSDVVCGAWWYKNPRWERRTIPGVVQIVNAYDLDHDGRKELIGLKGKPGAGDFYNALSSRLCWLKAIDPVHDRWREHPIGTGSGDWPHGTTVAPLLPGGKLALVTGYHNRTHPEIFEIPDDPAASPWKRRVIAEIPYGEEMVPYDLDGDGKLDVVAGPYWLENTGNGKFTPHLLAQGFTKVARIALADINGDGKQDIVLGEEDGDWGIRKIFFARVAWLENTGDPRHKAFSPHVVDRILCPALAVGRRSRRRRQAGDRRR